MYRISYQVLSTGFSGHGDFCLTKEDAESWIERLNKEYPDINHWIEDTSDVAPGTQNNGSVSLPDYTMI